MTRKPKTKDPRRTAYEVALITRVKALRKAIGLSQDDMARILEISRENLNQYEQRGGLPAYLFELFARITGSDLRFLVTGVPEQDASAPRAVSEATFLAAVELTVALIQQTGRTDLSPREIALTALGYARNPLALRTAQPSSLEEFLAGPSQAERSSRTKKS